jgi:hypothetical protein
VSCSTVKNLARNLKSRRFEALLGKSGIVSVVYYLTDSGIGWLLLLSSR